FANIFGVTPQGVGGYVVYRPDHWVFKDTGITYGDVLGRSNTILFHEVDGCPIRMEYGLPYPAKDYDGPSSLEILGMVPAGFTSPGAVKKVAAAVFGQDAKTMERISEIDVLKTIATATFGQSDPKTVERISHNHAVMSIYTNNGTVFCGGTTHW